MAVETLLRAMNSGSADRILAALPHDATVHVGDSVYAAPSLRDWAEAFVAGAPYELRVMSRGGSRDEPVLAIQIYRGAHVEGPFAYKMRILDGRILHLGIAESHGPAMPSVVGRLLDAANHGDLAELLRCFAEDALVNDELVEYAGGDRIRLWGERHVIGRKLALHAVRCVASQERAVVTAHVTGEFDARGLPDPLVLSLYFSLTGDSIGQLIVLQNLEGDRPG